METDPKIFLKAPWRQYFLILRGGAPKKTQFLVKICQKVPKNAFFGLFFISLLVAQKILPKQGLFSALEIHSLLDLKKKVDKVFLKIRHPRENPRSAPVGPSD